MRPLPVVARRLLVAVDRAAQSEASAARRQNNAQHPSTRAVMLREINEARTELRAVLDAEGST